ncbi:MAG TPA: hypothetical protein VJR29_01825 [bacterium]|nr:hypothetical protein [bacterium]
MKTFMRIVVGSALGVLIALPNLHATVLNACNKQALVGEWNINATGYLSLIPGVPFPITTGDSLPVLAAGKAVYKVLPNGQGEVRGFTTDVIGGISEVEVPFVGEYSMGLKNIGGTNVCVGDIKLESFHDAEHGGPHWHCFQVMPSRLFEEFKYISYPCPEGYPQGGGFEAIQGISQRDKF